MPTLTPTILAPISTGLLPTTSRPRGRSPYRENGKFVFNSSGQMVLASPLQSEIYLIKKALSTSRTKWRRIYGGKFGSEIPNIVGKSLPTDTKEYLIEKMVRESIQHYGSIREIVSVKATIEEDTCYVDIHLLLTSGDEIHLQNSWVVL